MTSPLKKPTDVSSSSSVVTTSTASSVASTGSFKMSGDWLAVAAAEAAKQHQARKPSDVLSAVHAHLNALRKLGRTNITIGELAQTLGLTAEEVQAAVTALKPKGVKTPA